MAPMHLESHHVRLVAGPVAVLTERSPVWALLSGPAVTIAADATLADAAALMERTGAPAILVEQAGRLLTERDLAWAFGHGLGADARVDEVATSVPVVVAGSASIMDTCSRMLNEHAPHVLVEHEGTIGLVSMVAITAVLLQTADPDLWLASLRASLDAPTEIWLG